MSLPFESIAAVTIGFVSFYAGTAAATAGQDREAWRRLIGAAKTLLVDVARIEGELGLPGSLSSPGSIHGSEAALPNIHPWIVPIIVQIAESRPEIVAGFMKLERELVNLAAFRQTAALQRAVVEARRLECEQAEKLTPRTYDPLTDLSHDLESVDTASEAMREELTRYLFEQSAAIARQREEASDQLAASIDALGGVRSTIDRIDGQVRATLADLRLRLVTVADKPVPSVFAIMMRAAVPSLPALGMPGAKSIGSGAPVPDSTRSTLGRPTR